MQTDMLTQVAKQGRNALHGAQIGQSEVNRHKWLSGALGSLLFITVWLFLGIEEIPREHGTDYLLFAKQQPTLRVVYRNPAVCGECDVEPLSALSQAKLEAFADFCRIQFDLDEARTCHAVYAETQRITSERLRRGAAR